MITQLQAAFSEPGCNYYWQKKTTLTEVLKSREEYIPQKLKKGGTSTISRHLGITKPEKAKTVT